MKIRLIFWCCVLVVLWSCSDDDSGTMRELVNWFEIKDNPNDELQHLTYQIYEEYGIPIFYNDTIGSEVRGKNADGSPNIYYEVLNGGYKLLSTQELSYANPQNRNNIKIGIELLRDRVIARLPKEVHVHSFLLADTIYMIDNNWQKMELTAYCSMMTTLVGKILYMDNMTNAEKEYWAAEVWATQFTAYLENNAEKELKDFYAVINSVLVDDRPAYYFMFIGAWRSMQPEEFGCITSIPRPPSGFNLPKDKDDLKAFLIAYYNSPESDFKEKYKDYPLVIQKYDWIKDFIASNFK